MVIINPFEHTAVVTHPAWTYKQTKKPGIKPQIQWLWDDCATSWATAACCFRSIKARDTLVAVIHLIWTNIKPDWCRDTPRGIGLIAAWADRSLKFRPEDKHIGELPHSKKNNNSNRTKVQVRWWWLARQVKRLWRWSVEGDEGRVGQAETGALHGQRRTEECGDLAPALGSSWVRTEWGD